MRLNLYKFSILMKRYWEEQKCFKFLICIRINLFVFSHICVKSEKEKTLGQETKSYINSYIKLYIKSYINSYIKSYIKSYIESYINSYIKSFIKSYIKSYIKSGDKIVHKFDLLLLFSLPCTYYDPIPWNILIYN